MKHTPWPRRKKARVWGGIAATLFVLLMLTHKICLTPTQAIRAAETELGTGKTEVVMTLSYRDVPFYLTRNEKALLLVPFSPKLFLMGQRYAAFADCTLDQGHVHAAGTILRNERASERVFLIVGCTDLPNAASVYVHDTRSQDFSGCIPTSVSATVSPEGYFWGMDTVPINVSCFTPSALEVRDANGTVLETYDMAQNWQGEFAYHSW